ncbi:MAG: phosphoglycerate kinase [Candidatus Harrisonbacteria bacterium]|nr:phosphoglycerate kinase [Candidatus Harrisonbacteria bacterium]
MGYLSQLKPQELKNKVCLLRLDFNTEDNWRLDAGLPTLKFLAKNCKAVVILSHKGRPEGFDRSLSLKPITKILRKALGKTVTFVPHFRFLEIRELVHASPRGAVFLLENLRFLEEEADNNEILAEHLASIGNIYVNDAFAVSHRANASVVAITKYIKSYAGFGLESEIKNLSRVMTAPKQPLAVILGGLKIEDKMQVIDNLKDRTVSFLVGGALTSEILDQLKSPKIILPVDFKKDDGEIKDIGRKTANFFQKEIAKAQTIIWNGPVGDINKNKFSHGTKAVAQAVVKNKKAFKVVGGGETVMFLKKLKLDKKINFISTGGGAMLDFLAGKVLPGIKALENHD